MRWTAITLMSIALLMFAVAPGLAANQEGAKPNTEKLMNPAQLNETAPEKFQVNVETSKGLITIEVTRSWAPHGADRFYNLVKNGYYDGCRFFRWTDYIIQFGINGNPKLNAVWRSARIPDDPVKQSNLRGYITFAKQTAPDTRTTQVFINTRATGNAGLDSQVFAPFGKVTKGMNVVNQRNGTLFKPNTFT